MSDKIRRPESGVQVEEGCADSATNERSIVSHTFLENGNEPLSIEADLAGIVQRMRMDWIRCIAPFWSEIVAINKRPASELDKCIAVLFGQGFVEFSNFLCLFEHLFVDLKYRDLSREELIHNLGKAGRKFLESGIDFDGFNEIYSRLDCADNGRRACGDCGELGDIHDERFL